MTIDETKMYTDIGKSIVVFQYLESLIKQIAHFAIDRNYQESTRISLDSHSFAKLRDVSEVIICEVLRKQGVEDAEIRIQQYHKLMAEARAIASLRNRLVHSAYLFLEGGGELMKILQVHSSIKISGKEGPRRKILIEDLHSLSFEGFQESCAKIAWELSLFKTYLIHNLHKHPN